MFGTLGLGGGERFQRRRQDSGSVASGGGPGVDLSDLDDALFDDEGEPSVLEENVANQCPP